MLRHYHECLVGQNRLKIVLASFYKEFFRHVKFHVEQSNTAILSMFHFGITCVKMSSICDIHCHYLPSHAARSPNLVRKHDMHGRRLGHDMKSLLFTAKASFIHSSVRQHKQPHVRHDLTRRNIKSTRQGNLQAQSPWGRPFLPSSVLP